MTDGVLMDTTWTQFDNDRKRFRDEHQKSERRN